jgi:hypothetical protein
VCRRQLSSGHTLDQNWDEVRYFDVGKSLTGSGEGGQDVILGATRVFSVFVDEVGLASAVALPTAGLRVLFLRNGLLTEKPVFEVNLSSYHNTRLGGRG